MANRLKEDEKNERIIRGLLKLPENRRCINCNSLGPQYVCTNFSTFVCTTCSGTHREFTHRVKSISMAKFSSQEVSALQGGGNANAKEIYLKEWDTQRHAFPDSSNVDRLRDFIKHVYVDRRYTGERSFDKPPRVKGEIENENRGSDPYQGGSRSPPYEYTYDCRYSDGRSPGGRSPGYEQGSRPYGDYGRSPARTEIINDWQRDDRFGNGRRSDESRISDGGSSRSPDHQKDQDMSSPPMVRPVREILGQSVSPLRVIEPPKANDGRSADVSVRTQRTTSSSSLASSNGNPAEFKVESSLIDFETIPDPTVNAAVPQTQQTLVPPKQQITVSQTQQPTPLLSNVQSTSSNVDNWANFDPVAEVKVSQAPSNANSLESLFLELSVPTPVPGPMTGVSFNVGAPITTHLGNLSALPSDSLPIAPVRSSFGIGATDATPRNSLSLPPAGAPPASVGPTVMLPNSDGYSFANATNGGQWPGMQHPHSMFPAGGVQPNPQILTPASVQASSNQSWNSLLGTTAQGPFGAAPAQATQAILKPTIEATSGVGTQPSPGEVRTSGRKELPVDLFTSNYRTFHAPVPGWQTGQFHGIGLPMRYNIAVPMPAFPQQSKSTNPFDTVSKPSSVQIQMFPSMASLQGALPNMGGPAVLLSTSSLGTSSSPWMPPHAPTYVSEMPPSLYTGQKMTSNISVSQQGIAGFPLEGPSFGTLNSNQQPSALYSAPPANSSSVGGNPFG